VAVIVNDLNINGISSVIMNYCRNINSERIAFTIISGRPVAEVYQQECKLKGIQIITLSERRKKPVHYYYELFKVLTKKQFDIVHVHGSSATIIVELFIAMLRGIKVRIAHCHANNCNNRKIHYFLRKWMPFISTHDFACSESAGKWLVGDAEFCIIKNGFEIEQFQFNEDIRKIKRKELCVENKFVIGHVGRFNEVKNHKFLLEIFEEIAKKRTDAVLLLIGTGPMFQEIAERIAHHPYRERIILYGESRNVKDFYSVMDVFVLPSKYEGLSIVLLEAQMNGLKCIVSDGVPEEVKLSDRIEFLSLQEEKKVWLDRILAAKSQQRKEVFEIFREQFDQYSIKKNVVFLEEMYYSFYKEKYPEMKVRG